MLLHNIPIVVYSTALLVVLHLWLSERAKHIEPESSSSSSMPWTWTLSIVLLKVLGWIPVGSAVGFFLWEHQRRKKQQPHPPSLLFDADGTTVETYSRKKHLPFLPDREYCTEEDYNYRQLNIEKTSKTRGKVLQWMTMQAQSGTGISPLAVSDKASWALVTGASGGIGRAICISLARRKIPLVLVARNFHKLKELAEEVQEVYGVMAVPMACDVTNPTQVQGLLKTLANSHPPTTKGGESKHCLLDKIDILVNNAGVGDLGDFFQTPAMDASHNGYDNDYYSDVGYDKDEDKKDEVGDTANDHHISVESMIQLNVVGATQLTQAIGSHMLRVRQQNASTSEDAKAGARIVFVASVAGMYPGVPGTAVYAATKAYQKSLCASLSLELEEQSNGQIRMVCVLPGATKDTHFASTAHMTQCACFHVLPTLNWLGCGAGLTAEQVAETTVLAAIRGTQREVVVGIFYRFSALLNPLLPDGLALFLTGLSVLDFGYFGATPASSKLWWFFSKFVFLPNVGGGDDDETKNSSNSTSKKNN